MREGVAKFVAGCAFSEYVPVMRGMSEVVWRPACMHVYACVYVCACVCVCHRAAQLIVKIKRDLDSHL